MLQGSLQLAEEVKLPGISSAGFRAQGLGSSLRWWLLVLQGSLQLAEEEKLPGSGSATPVGRTLAVTGEVHTYARLKSILVTYTTSGMALLYTNPTCDTQHT